MTGRVVILVPRREGIPDRDRLWAFCRPWWQQQFPGWPVIEGHHDDGLFSRSAAVNMAAHLAGDWDVAVIIDADVLTHPPNVQKAVWMAHESGRLVVPFDVRHNLNRNGTERALEGDSGSWKPYIARSYGDQHSAVIAVPRRLWDEVGGFDEGFRGWGLEDTAFAIACETLAGPLLRIEGEVWHLHHAAAAGQKHGSPSHTANVQRAARYRSAQAAGDRDAVRSLVVEGRQAASTADLTIPRILHRVVPEVTDPQAEAWWIEFGRLHPGWRLMTHRDPLIASEWPETSPYWGRCANGAQLADIVRLEALWRWGGIYMDQDMQPLRSLDPLLPLEGFAAWEDERSIPNAVLGARAGHTAIRECLDLSLARIGAKRRTNGPGGTWEAGPAVTTKVLVGRADFLVLPPETFYPVHYRAAREALPTFDAKRHPWAFAVHHWWGSWLPAEMRWNDAPGAVVTKETDGERSVLARTTSRRSARSIDQPTVAA